MAGAVTWAVDLTAGRPAHFRTRPWAEVWRVEAPGETWWLKINSAATGYEPRLHAALSTLRPGLLPAVRVHPTQPWSLIADAGRSAREQLADATPEERLDYWCRLLPAYAELQQSATGSALAGVGVPDFRVPELGRRFAELVADPAWLAAEIAGDLGPDAERRVAGIGPRLDQAATLLGEAMPPTVQHDDLHDANVFGAGADAKIIDWGDAVIGHPFGTLLVTLGVLAAQLDTETSDPRLDRVRNAYLEPWRTRGESSPELLRQLDLAVRLGALTRAAGWQRALGTPAAGVEVDCGDAVAYWLIRLDQALSDLLPTAPAGRQH